MQLTPSVCPARLFIVTHGRVESRKHLKELAWQLIANIR
jgi:hypothetical protein